MKLLNKIKKSKTALAIMVAVSAVIELVSLVIFVIFADALAYGQAREGWGIVAITFVIMMISAASIGWSVMELEKKA